MFLLPNQRIEFYEPKHFRPVFEEAVVFTDRNLSESFEIGDDHFGIAFLGHGRIPTEIRLVDRQRPWKGVESTTWSVNQHLHHLDHPSNKDVEIWLLQVNSRIPQKDWVGKRFLSARSTSSIPLKVLSVEEEWITCGGEGYQSGIEVWRAPKGYTLQSYQFPPSHGMVLADDELPHLQPRLYMCAHCEQVQAYFYHWGHYWRHADPPYYFCDAKCFAAFQAAHPEISFRGIF